MLLTNFLYPGCDYSDGSHKQFYVQVKYFSDCKQLYSQIFFHYQIAVKMVLQSIKLQATSATRLDSRTVRITNSVILLQQYEFVFSLWSRMKVHQINLMN